jgi:hypothetical protein
VVVAEVERVRADRLGVGDRLAMRVGSRTVVVEVVVVGMSEGVVTLGLGSVLYPDLPPVYGDARPYYRYRRIVEAGGE